MHNDTWQLQEAKAKLSELVNAAINKPQTITVRGKKKVTVVATSRYEKLTRKKKKMSLGAFLDKSPLKGMNLDPYIKRHKETPRDTGF